MNLKVHGAWRAKGRTNITLISIASLSPENLANLICKGVTNCWHNMDGICAGNISSEHSLCWWWLHREFALGCFFSKLFVCVFPALRIVYPEWCLFLWRWSQCLSFLPPLPPISFPLFPLFLCLSVSLIQFGVGIHLQPSISLADCQKTGHTGRVHVQFIHWVGTLSCSCYKYLQVQDVIETKFISLKRLDEVPVCIYVC